MATPLMGWMRTWPFTADRPSPCPPINWRQSEGSGICTGNRRDFLFLQACITSASGPCARLQGGCRYGKLTVTESLQNKSAAWADGWELVNESSGIQEKTSDFSNILYRSVVYVRGIYNSIFRLLLSCHYQT